MRFFAGAIIDEKNTFTNSGYPPYPKGYSSALKDTVPGKVATVEFYLVKFAVVYFQFIGSNFCRKLDEW